MNTLLDQLMNKAGEITSRPGRLTKMADALLARVAHKDSAAAWECWSEYKVVDNCGFRRTCCRQGTLVICDPWHKVGCF